MLSLKSCRWNFTKTTNCPLYKTSTVTILFTMKYEMQRCLTLYLALPPINAALLAYSDIGRLLPKADAGRLAIC